MERTAGILPRRSGNYHFFFYGTDSGSWTLLSQPYQGTRTNRDGPWDWSGIGGYHPSLNDGMNLRVNLVNERNQGFLKALREASQEYPELLEFVVYGSTSRSLNVGEFLGVSPRVRMAGRVLTAYLNQELLDLSSRQAFITSPVHDEKSAQVVMSNVVEVMVEKMAPKIGEAIGSSFHYYKPINLDQALKAFLRSSYGRESLRLAKVDSDIYHGLGLFIGKNLAIASSGAIEWGSGLLFSILGGLKGVARRLLRQVLPDASQSRHRDNAYETFTLAEWFQKAVALTKGGAAVSDFTPLKAIPIILNRFDEYMEEEYGPQDYRYHTQVYLYRNANQIVKWLLDAMKQGVKSSAAQIEQNYAKRHKSSSQEKTAIIGWLIDALINTVKGLFHNFQSTVFRSQPLSEDLFMKEIKRLIQQAQPEINSAFASGLEAPKAKLLEDAISKISTKRMLEILRFDLYPSLVGAMKPVLSTGFTPLDVRGLH